MKKENKSRAEYFRNRRKEMYQIGGLVTKEDGEMLEHVLKVKGITRTDWIKEKITEDFNKLKK